MRRTCIVAPAEAEIIHVESDRCLVDVRQDLKSRQIAELVGKFDLGQLAVGETWARWLRKSLGRDFRVESIVADEIDGAFARPSIGTPNPSGIGIDPIGAFIDSRTRSDLAM